MKYLIGSDEVGTGACAAGFVVCAIRALAPWNLKGLNDSKKLSAKKRTEIAQQLLYLNDIGEIDCILIEVSNANIDLQGLGTTLKAAHTEAINILADANAEAVVDGKINIIADCPTSSVIKADASIPVVMAASILSKYYRDSVMQRLDTEYPQYNWKSNVGYVTAEHKEAIRQHGLSPYHRKSVKLNINN
jgi:ribonuclease HII